MRIGTLSANVLSGAVLAALLAACGQSTPAVSLVSPAVAQPAANDARAATATLPEVLSSTERSIVFSQAHPDGWRREARYDIVDRQYVISERERAAARAAGRDVYDVQVLQTPLDNGTVTVRVEFFVPYDAMPRELRELLQPAAAVNWPALLGIRDAHAQGAASAGIGVILTDTFKEVTEQALGQLTERLGRGQTLAAAFSAALDIQEARDLQRETEAHLKRLDALEDCAKNPTHQVPVSPEEQQRTLDTLARIRADLQQVTAVRFLGIVADYPLGFMQNAGGPVAGVAAAGLAIALKPFGSWSNEALKSFTEDTLMREAEAAVVPCTKECEAAAAPPAAQPTSAPAPRGAAQPTGAPRANAPAAAATPRAASAGPQPQAAQQCERNRVTVRLRKVDRYADLSGFGYGDHRQTIWGTTTVSQTPFGDLDGTGTATFRESADVVVYDWCHRRVRSAVEATMTVKISPDSGEVQVGFTSDSLFPNDQLYEREPNNPQCMTFTNTEPGPELNLGCTFDNVDLENGGYYAGPENYVYVDDDDDQLYQCFLRLGGPEEDPPPPEPDPPPPAGSPRFSAALPNGQAPAAAPAAAGAAGAVTGATQAPPAPQQSGQDREQGGIYRATLLGLRAEAPTVDTAADDGAGDEVFAASAAILWDRAARSALDGRFVQSQLYRALAANGAAPAGFDPSDAVALAPTAESLPLLVWEGRLTAGGPAVIIVPSAWERDAQAQVFVAYQRGWQGPSRIGLGSEPAIAAQLATPALTVATATDPPSDDAPGRYVSIDMQSTANADRPIGIGTLTDTAAIYAERYIVITQEKVAHLTIGEGTTLTVPLEDVDPARLGGNYALYVSIQRVQ